MEILTQIIEFAQEAAGRTSVPVGADTNLQEIVDFCGCLVLWVKIVEKYGVGEFDLFDTKEQLKTPRAMAKEIEQIVLG